MTYPERRERALTLVELVVVLGVLVILAGLAVGRFGGWRDAADRTAVVRSLMTVRDAILGTADRPGFRDDCGRLPQSLQELFVRPDDVPAWSIETGSGWDGPYLEPRAAIPYVREPSKGYFAIYADEGDLMPLDPWGRPIVLQRPDTFGALDDVRDAYSRILSAGEDGEIQTPANVFDLDTTWIDEDGDGVPEIDSIADGDDVVLYLFQPAHPDPP